MEINNLEYAKIFQDELDKQMVIGATSGWMEPNSKLVKYNGGDEVKVPIISTSGLGDYDRDDGFAQGSVSLSYETLKMTQDRGRTFQLDAMDVNETNFVASAGNVMGDFQATKVVPEIDAYRYSKIATEAVAVSRVTDSYIPSADNILKMLRSDIYKIWDEIGDSVPLVISINTLAAHILEDSSEILKMLGVADFKKGELSFKVRTIDDIPIIKIPSARMHTEYFFKDGGEDQKEGGFEPTDDANKINWLITGRNTPMAISKTDTIRIFDPMTNQKAHAWKIDYRKYHDLWMMPNKKKSIWANIR